MTLTGRRVLFVLAAGPEMGFGHLSRSRALARALDVPHLVMLRGTAASRRAARALGARVVAYAAASLRQVAPDLVIVDDPSARSARRAVLWAREALVPVASLHDGGLAHVASDLVVDARVPHAPAESPLHLVGPAFTVLDPAWLVRRRAAVPRRPRRLLIALGGGRHVRQYGADLAFGITAVWPSAEIVVAPGFSSGRRPSLPTGARWLASADQMADELGRAAVAVVAGGLTLAEACVLGTPTVAVAVTRAQEPAIRAYAAAGAVTSAGRAGTRQSVSRVALAVCALMSGPQARRQARRARRLIDGQGAARVATALGWLVARREGRLHVA